jgi:hypothetical protein
VRVLSFVLALQLVLITPLQWSSNARTSADNKAALSPCRSSLDKARPTGQAASPFGLILCECNMQRTAQAVVWC